MILSELPQIRELSDYFKVCSLEIWRGQNDSKYASSLSGGVKLFQSVLP